MKVAYLLGSLNRGGTETLMLDICQNLKKTDFDAMVIYRKGGVLEQEFLQSGIPIYKLNPGKNPLKYLWKLRKMIADSHVDVIHAQQPLDTLYARIACIGLNKKIFLTFHGFDFNISNVLIRLIIRLTDKNIFVSHYQREYYISKYHLKPAKQTVVYNGINFGKFFLTDEKNADMELRKELKIKDTTLLLGMVGNFNVVRDQLTVCRFLKLLREQNIDFHFVFIGKRVDCSPQRYDDCVSYCDENNLSRFVSFPGVRKDVPHILSQLDAFIYATDHDTFGIAVVEAMAAGVPVFVNDWEVMREISDDGKQVTLYKTKDQEDLIEKFMLFLQNRETEKMKARETAILVREKYSIEKHLKNLKLVYSL